MARINQITRNNIYSNKSHNAFNKTCHLLIIDAYRTLKSTGYNVDWDEETFSANLRNEMEKACSKKQLPYHITREHVLDTQQILKGEAKAKTARKIDVVLSSFLVAKKLVYGIEAKILVENNFKSKKYSHLNSEYIHEGMDRYINQIYRIDGCIVGYIIEGDPDNIISKINNLFHKYNRNQEIIGNKFSLNSFDYCYISKHSNIYLTHFLLPFAQK